MERRDLAIIGLLAAIALALLATYLRLMSPQMSVAFCATLAAAATLQIVRRIKSR